MACPECGCEEMMTEYNDGISIIVCNGCGLPVDPLVPSNQESDMDDDDDFDDDFEDQQSSKDGKNTDKDCGETELVKSNDLNSKKVSASSQHKIRLISGSGKSEAAEVEQEMTAPTCKSCGGTNLILDSIHETEHLICEDCGAFTEEQNLVSTQDYTQSGGSSGYQQGWSGMSRFYNTESQINRGKIHGVKTIKAMCSQMNWQAFLTDEAVSLYENLYPDKGIKHTSSKFKDALCVACLYSVARNNEMNITLKTLMGLKKVKTKFVTRALKLLKSIHKKPLAHQAVSSLPEHVLAVGAFSQKFLNKVSKLVSVCEKGFVTQGRDHSHVVIAVAHLVWVSEDYQKRKSTCLSRFCAKHNLKYGRQCHLLQKHIKELFLKLARQLPWVSKPESIKESNYLHYLDKVASHGLSLVSRASQVDSEIQQKSANSSMCSSADGEMSSNPTLPHLAPPCMKSARNDVRSESPPRLPDHITAADLDKEDLCDSEFSDQEIDSYILTPEEAQSKRTLTDLQN